MYIDPSSGGLIFQVLAVTFGLLSGMVLVFSSKIKMGFAKFRRALRERSGGEEADPTASAETNPTSEE